MFLNYSLVCTLLVGAAVANGMTQQQQALLDYTAPLTGENSLDIVPLNKTATTGVLPIDVEQTILRLGNRFANEFYANISADGDLGKCIGIGCGATLVKELPCIYKAIKDKDLGELLKCGITKLDVSQYRCVPFLAILEAADASSFSFANALIVSPRYCASSSGSSAKPKKTVTWRIPTTTAPSII
ncbi:MAG: hypothetical protein Q9167_006136 [Letrouitia subvulpina]